MIDDLICEYLECAETAASVNYADTKSVHRFNAQSDRMRSIVTQVAALGQKSLTRFVSVLDKEPAALWASHQLVELAELDAVTLTKCFKRVLKAKLRAEEDGDMATAKGEDWWLKEWRAKCNYH